MTSAGVSMSATEAPISAGGGFIGLPEGFSCVAYSRPAGLVHCGPADAKTVFAFMSDVPRIRIADIHKSFGPVEVLRGVSFDVHRGSVVSVIGASGSGKSTLLRCVNYLEPPDSGEIYIEGAPLGSR